MPLYLDTPGLRLDAGYRLDQVEDFPLKPGEIAPVKPVKPFPQVKQRTNKYRMNDRQRNQVNRLLRVKGFCAEYVPSFTNTPALPGDAKFMAGKTGIDTLVAKLTGKQAKQASGGFSAATTDQETEREELLELMRLVNRTARAIAIELGQPGIMDRFRMPASNSDVVLAAAGDAFADAIVELNLAADILAHGYETDANIVKRAESQGQKDEDETLAGPPKRRDPDHGFSGTRLAGRRESLSAAP